MTDTEQEKNSLTKRIKRLKEDARNKEGYRASKKNKKDNTCYKQNRPLYRPGAQFITAGGKELIIETDGRFFVIRFWMGGPIPASLSSKYTSKVQAEQDIVSYLKQTDKVGLARYPGRPSKHGPFNGE